MDNIKPLTSFKKFYFTTEFIVASLLIGGLFVRQFFNPDWMLWLIAIVLVSSIYSISRGFHKKARTALLYGGERTSEFWLSVVSCLLLGYRIYTAQLNIDIGLLGIAVIIAAYVFSRGQAKSLGHQVKVNNF